MRWALHDFEQALHHQTHSISVVSHVVAARSLLVPRGLSYSFLSGFAAKTCGAHTRRASVVGFARGHEVMHSKLSGLACHSYPTMSSELEEETLLCRPHPWHQESLIANALQILLGARHHDAPREFVREIAIWLAPHAAF